MRTASLAAALAAGALIAACSKPEPAGGAPSPDVVTTDSAPTDPVAAATDSTMVVARPDSMATDSSAVEDSAAAMPTDSSAMKDSAAMMLPDSMAASDTTLKH